MYIVISVEHTSSFDDVPVLMGKYDTLEEAKKRKDEIIVESMANFPYQQEDDGLLYTTDEGGSMDYGFVVTIIEV